ncbi:hypothetical protein BH708_06960 [Brachybacterium sp. P6-10-X1]|nr:hypothetical protein BH708_06950 [Brachybacterium sp. P6-10-X1]APX32505.1 hypothetical protein BH708_06960 [Brachybacterium sp. P6-10-X1]
MNPDEGREVASAINESGSQILDAIDAVSSVVTSVEWVGPDYDAYLDEWNSFVSGPVTGLIEGFQRRSDKLNEHAEEQDTTSNKQ